MQKPKECGEFTIFSLPSEVIFKVCHYLSATDIISLSSTCLRLHEILQDDYLWDSILIKLICFKWTTLLGPIQSKDRMEDAENEKPFHEQHSQKVFAKICPYVNSFELSLSNNTISITDQMKRAKELEEKGYATSSYYSFLETAKNNLILYLGTLKRSMAANHRFIVSGSGLDRIETSLLFSRMLDKRSDSFTPISLISSHKNIGSGLRISLPERSQEKIISSKVANLQPLSESVYESLREYFGLSRPVEAMKKPHENIKIAFDISEIKFDFIKLYSTYAHLNFQSPDQLTRIRQNQSFKLDENDENLENLCPIDDLISLCKDIDGIIYAVNAKDSYEEMELLYYELKCLLKAFPDPSKIPILILYIWPGETIYQTLHQQMKVAMRAHNEEPFREYSRDSIAGREYTRACKTSLLKPFDALRLKDLSNPWRLQKCTSNDIESLVEGFIWLSNKSI